MRRGKGALHESSPGDFQRRVHQVVTALAEGGPPKVHQVASCVGTSVRTLQRRLRSAGGSYAGVLQQVRCQAAEQMLADSARAIGDVARALGYSDPAHFTRAFLRWTSLTPTDFRRREGARAAARAKRPRSGASARRLRRRDEEAHDPRRRQYHHHRVPHGPWGGEDQSTHAKCLTYVNRLS